MLGIVAGFAAVAYEPNAARDNQSIQQTRSLARRAASRSKSGPPSGRLAWFRPGIGRRRRSDHLAYAGRIVGTISVIATACFCVCLRASVPCPTRPVLRAAYSHPCWSWDAAARSWSLETYAGRRSPLLDIRPGRFCRRWDGRFLYGRRKRPPITGIVLVTEMTGSFTMLLPMLGACFAAHGCVPTFLSNAPIYDSLAGASHRAGQELDEIGRHAIVQHSRRSRASRSLAEPRDWCVAVVTSRIKRILVAASRS